MAQSSRSLRGWALEVGSQRPGASLERGGGGGGVKGDVHGLVVDERVPDKVFHVRVSVDRTKSAQRRRRWELCVWVQQRIGRPASSSQFEVPTPSRQLLRTASHSETGVPAVFARREHARRSREEGVKGWDRQSRRFVGSPGRSGRGRAVKSPTDEAVRCNRMRWRGFFVTSWTNTGHKNRPTQAAAGRTGGAETKRGILKKATEKNRRHGLTRHCDLGGEGLPLRGPTTSRGKLSPTRLALESETGVSFPPPCDNRTVVEHRSD
jgi:hypothetical protein